MRMFVTLLWVLCCAGSAWSAILTDDFSDNNYTANPAWGVESGQFAADGRSGFYYGPYAGAGMLAFGTTDNATIHLDFPQVAGNSPVTIEFDLVQSNDAHPCYCGFLFNIMDTQSSQSYNIYGQLTTDYFGNDAGGWTGFSSWRSDGSFTGGTSDKCLLNGWQHVVIQFDPTTGVQMSYGGDVVSSFVNFKDLTRINRLTLSSGNVVSWFVDNVEVTYVPEPATMAMLTLGGLFLRRRR